MSELSTKTREEIDVAAIVSTFVYTDDINSSYLNKDLETIMKMLPDSVRESEDYKGAVEAVEAAIAENPSLGKLELISQSDEDEMGLVIACAFRDPYEDTIYVSYRGTGDGKWVDNGEALARESSVMQDKCVEYYDHIYENVLTDEQKKNSKIIVTGHSKGGNEAQFVMLTSKYRESIDACYSIDGQGFSKAALEKIKATFTEEEYNDYVSRMYSINGENDYVHDLGITIIPEENTYFIPTPEADGMGGFHGITYMLNGSGLNWEMDEYGRVSHGKQGIVGTFAKNISERMMQFDDEQLYDAAVTVMYLCERFLPYNDVTGGEYHYGTGNRKKATVKEILTTLELLFTTDFVVDVIKNTALDLLTATVEDVLDKVKNWIDKKCQEIVNIYNQYFNYGYKYSEENPEISVNTVLLREYANRLNNVNIRISAIDKRMDSLYWKVGLEGLWNLLKADLLTGYSWRLTKCKNYLYDTADIFDTAENGILSKL